MTDQLVHGLDIFFAKFKPLRYKKGEVIFRAGDPPLGIYYLKKGYVKVYSVSKSGEELTLIIFKPGDIFPVSWAVGNIGVSYFVEAMTEALFWRVPRDQFLKFVKNKPEILFELIRRMMVRFVGLMQRMEYMVFGDAGTKVAAVLLIVAERFGVLRDKKKEIVIQVPLTHNQIANLIGLSRETTSIEMKKFENKGLINYRGRLLVVKNLAGLRRESLFD